MVGGRNMINRIRYVIMRNNRTEILCGMAEHFRFKKINELEKTPIKTYFSEYKAISSFMSIPRWPGNEDIEIVKVREILQII